MMKRVSIFLCGIFLGACAPMRNLELGDLRTESNLRQVGTLQMTVQAARACAIATNYCQPSGGAGVVDDPAGNGFSLMIYGMGLTKMNPYLVIDLRNENGMAAYRGYTAMPTWNSAITDQLTRISACGDCSKL